MFTFITIVTTILPNNMWQGEVEVAKVETRALTAVQAEKQALSKCDLTVRDGFGRVIEDPELKIKTIRKFAVEVERKLT